VTLRQPVLDELESARALDGARVVWSMWPGYLERDSGARLRAWTATRGIPMTVLHSSGHARAIDLKRFADAVDPEYVVPIHTEHPERYEEIFDRVVPHPDREPWGV
jgi:ribonuclease J